MNPKFAKFENHFLIQIINEYAIIYSLSPTNNLLVNNITSCFTKIYILLLIWHKVKKPDL